MSQKALHIVLIMTSCTRISPSRSLAQEAQEGQMSVASTGGHVMSSICAEYHYTQLKTV